MQTRIAGTVLLLLSMVAISGCPTQGQYSSNGINLFLQLPGAEITLEQNAGVSTELLRENAQAGTTETLTFNENNVVQYLLLTPNAGSVSTSGSYVIISRDTALLTLLDVDYVLRAHGISADNTLLVSMTSIVGTGQV